MGGSKISVSISHEASTILELLVEEQKTNRSKIVDKAILFYAESQGWEFVPARIVKVER